MQMESDMIKTLDRIAEAIEKASQPGLIEYLAIGISLISVVVSGIAIIFAVNVADKQNKIALFEKRYAAYCEFLCLDKLSRTLKDIEFQPQFNGSIKLSLDEISNEFIKNRTLLLNVLKICLSWNIDVDDWETTILQMDNYIKNFQLSIFSLIFLFKFDESFNIMEDEVQDIFRNMSEMICLVFEESYESDDRIKEANRIKIELTTAIDDFYRKYANAMEKQLRVSMR